ncbi:bifunctional protein-disulfide isomerase/oxidoreductase DsbC [Thalassotalea sp. PLHSN55]|uniref:bifunctional protein-disulfide isomerase/oxidoreductase DsbC n=1 Tax=Thalassotalea sp. PLHSN55 TaxID=3435888 RepID=UPI003F82FED0
MRFIKRRLLVLASALSLAALLPASAETATDADIINKLKGLGLTASEVSDTPIANIKEVITDKGVFYVTSDNRYFFQGRLFDMNNKFENLTENTQSELRANGIDAFKDSMISFPAKNEQYQVTVFTDPTCGYCRKLHNEMDEYNALGISVNYLAFPRGGINSASYRDIKSVWCADDQKLAMDAAKSTGDVKNASCSAPIKAHFDLGRSFGITGTPAIIFADGTMVPGYKSPKDLLKALKKTDKP